MSSSTFLLKFSTCSDLPYFLPHFNQKKFYLMHQVLNSYFFSAVMWTFFPMFTACKLACVICNFLKCTCLLILKTSKGSFYHVVKPNYSVFHYFTFRKCSTWLPPIPTQILLVFLVIFQKVGNPKITNLLICIK